MATTKVSYMLYPQPWELAVWANQERYPTHKRYPMLKASEVLSDDVFLAQQDVDALGGASTVQPYLQRRRGDQCTCHLDLVLLRNDSEAVPNLSTFPPRVDVPDDIVAVMPHCTDVGDPLIPFAGVRRIVRQCHFEAPPVTRVLPGFLDSELTMRHETWIDTGRRQMTIVTRNETWSGTATIGDVTIYRALDGQDTVRPWRGKAPVAPLTPEYAWAEQPPHQQGSSWCLFMQYAYFQVSLKIPFRSRVEQSLLNTYKRSTEKGRMLDMELMAQRMNLDA